MTTLSRSSLQAAVEHGISASKELIVTQKTALRDVAKTTTQTAVGTSTHDGCGCPARQAGLWTGITMAPGALAFAMAFDAYLRQNHGLNGPRVVNVV